MLHLPSCFAAVILSFAPLFFQRSWQHAEVLLIGAILAPGKRTVTRRCGEVVISMKRARRTLMETTTSPRFSFSLAGLRRRSAARTEQWRAGFAPTRWERADLARRHPPPARWPYRQSRHTNREVVGADIAGRPFNARRHAGELEDSQSVAEH